MVKITVNGVHVIKNHGWKVIKIVSNEELFSTGKMYYVFSDGKVQKTHTGSVDATLYTRIKDANVMEVSQNGCLITAQYIAVYCDSSSITLNEEQSTFSIPKYDLSGLETVALKRIGIDSYRKILMQSDSSSLSDYAKVYKAFDFDIDSDVLQLSVNNEFMHIFTMLKNGLTYDEEMDDFTSLLSKFINEITDVNNIYTYKDLLSETKQWLGATTNEQLSLAKNQDYACIYFLRDFFEHRFESFPENFKNWIYECSVDNLSFCDVLTLANRFLIMFDNPDELLCAAFIDYYRKWRFQFSLDDFLEMYQSGNGLISPRKYIKSRIYDTVGNNKIHCSRINAFIDTAIEKQDVLTALKLLNGKCKLKKEEIDMLA